MLRKAWDLYYDGFREYAPVGKNSLAYYHY